MKRAVSLMSLALVLLLTAAPSDDVQSQATAEFVDGEVIVKIKDSVPPVDAAALSASVGAVVDRRFASIGAELWTIDGMSVSEAVGQLQADDRVEYAEPNYIVHATQVFPDDPRFSDLWGLHNTGQTGGTPDADIDAPEAWASVTGGDVLVGVIDTGVDYNHPDLADNIWTNPGEIAGNGIDDDGNGFIDDIHGWDFFNNDNDPFDDNSHGTHVSGTIAGIGNNGIGVVGVSWSARIMALKFLSAAGSGSTADAIEAVEYATMMGARLTNNSWGGGGFSQGLKDAIEAAGDEGYLFVAAAGNTGRDSDVTPHYPASYDLDNIISVANTTHTDGLAGSSTFGLVSVDLGAPGSSILSTIPGGGYGTKTGTSMASPHVAGAVSLLWSAAPLMGHLEVKNLIMSSVDPLPSLDGKTVTGGRLNVATLLSGLDSIPPDPVVDLSVVSTGSNTITLEWTATGDDTSWGTAAVYDVRYSTSPIDEFNFDAAPQAVGTPAPMPAGQSESFMVTGLDFLTMYYVALRVFDEQLNGSPISNVVTGTTLGIPSLTFSPASFGDSLITGGTSTHMMAVGNDADGTLDFSLSGLPSWLRANPASGRAYPGDDVDVEIVFDAYGLHTGDYTGDIALETNDPAQPIVMIPVSLHSTAAPDIALSDAALDYGPALIGTTELDTILVTNAGTLFLNVSGVSIDAPGFSVDPGPFVVGLGETHELVVSFSPTTTGPFAATLTITSDDPDEAVVEVALSGEGVEPPDIAVTPSSYTESLYTGGTSAQTMTIENNGGADLEFAIVTGEAETAAQASSGVSIPASTGDDFPRGTATPSIGPVPFEGGPAAPTSSAEPALSPGGSAFATAILGVGSGFATLFDVGTPGVLHNIGPANQFIWAGDFALGDNSFAYVINDGNQFIQVDTTSGGQTVIGSLVPFGAEIWTGMAIDPTDGQMYATSTDVGASSLYLIDPVAVTATRIGAIGFPGIIAVAVDDNGDMFAHDIVTDELVSIDKATAQGTAIGSLGYDANYGQGMAFDSETGQLYLAAVNNATLNAELRIADRTTGATALVGVLGSIDPGRRVQLGWMALPVSGVPWLTVSPNSGVVPPGGAMQVDVIFDADDLDAGGYDAEITVSSNDLTDDELTFPAHLDVTAATDIALSDDGFDFGVVLIGAAPSEVLTVTNDGVLPLSVTDITSDNGDYTVDLTNFNLLPGESENVTVTYTPTTPGPSNGTLSVESNDPDEPSVSVALSGEAVNPPVIAVSPDSMPESLTTGQMSTQTLTIDNSAGGSDLEWNSQVQLLGAAAQSYTLTAPGQAAPDPDSGETMTEGWRDTPISATLLDLTGVRIMYDQSHGQGSSTIWGIIIADLQSRGATVDLNSDQFTPELLADYDIVWMTDVSVQPDASEINALASWLTASHGLVLEGDNGTSTIAYNAILSNVGAGMAYLSIPGTSGTTTNIYPHETTAGVSSIYLASNSAYLSGVAFPGIPLVDDITGLTNTACSIVGTGRIVAVADESFSNSRMGAADNQLFANQVFDWVSSAVDWVSMEPEGGIVPAGASVDVDVTFDATGLAGGAYDASLGISNNDPSNPLVIVPAHLDVTAAADIAVSETSIDFGIVFLGGADVETVTVWNTGSLVLLVTGVTTDHADYAVDGAAFVLFPGAVKNLEVTYTPSTTGPTTATLSIACNDPDEPTVDVALSGESLEAPVISVSLDSLYESLPTGGAATHVMSITNTGGSDLEYTISTGERSSSPPFTMVGKGGVRDRQLGADDDPGPGIYPDQNSRTPYAAEPIESVVSTDDDPSVLVIQDASAWGLSMGSFLASEFGISATVINSSQIASTDFSAYDLIITTGSQSSTYYSLISSNVAKFESFLAAGGIVQYQAATQGQNVALAGGVTSVFGSFDNFNDNVAPAHPIMAGLPAQLEGTYANHNNLTGLPPSAEVLTVTSGTGLPTTAEYPHGAGTVIATGMTWEYLYVNGFVAGQMLYNAVAYTLEGAGFWLSADPTSGVVPPGETVDIEVAIDAGRLSAGSYDAEMLIEAANSPATDAALVPVHLDVTDAPDIVVTPTEIDFGVLFVGTAAVESVTVSNAGVLPLSVSGVATDHGDYAVGGSGFVLAPGASHTLPVTYSPSGAGATTATLSVASDDPDEPTVDVALSGEGEEIPIISVSVDSLYESLATGGTSTQIMSITNTGGGVLEYTIAASERTASPPPYVVGKGGVGDSQLGAGDDPGPGVFPDQNTHTPYEAEPVMPAVSIGSDPSVLVIQDASSWGLIMSNFLASVFGISATVINSSQIASTDFSPYDLIITTGSQSSTYYSLVSSNVAKFESFVAAGGLVQYQGATQGQNIAIVGGAQLVYGDFDEYNVNLLPSHPIMDGLPAMIYGPYANHNTASGLPGNAVILTETDISGQPTTVEYTYGAGTVIATGMTWEFLYNFGFPGGQMLVNAVAYALEGAGLWISTNPVSGEVPAGETVDIEVLFNAAGLLGGGYDALLSVDAVNSPMTDGVAVPAHLDVTGAPDIELSTTEIDFGVLFVGGTSVETVTVTNGGVLALSVSGVTTDHADYSVDGSGFVVGPGGSHDLEVTYAPAAPGPTTATLSIASNDPDESPAEVALSGEGRVAPVMSVAPESIVDSLITDERSLHLMTITNSGGSDLEFEASVRDAQGPFGAAMAIAVGRSSSDIERITATRKAYDDRPLPSSSYASQAENALGDYLMGPGHSFQSIEPLADLNVLYFSDLNSFSERAAEQALINLGVTYQAYVNNYSGFLVDLTSLEWDVVIYESAGNSRDIVPLTQYVADGGKLISSYWLYDATFATAMEAAYKGSFNTPLTVSQWSASHAVFTTPNDVPNLVPGPDDHWNDNGDRFQPVGSAVALGGFTASETPDQAAIVLGNNGRTLLNGFLFEDYLPIDEDSDGKSDVVELIENEVLFLSGAWLVVHPSTAVVPPTVSYNIQATLDATDLLGGDYSANVVISSDDPVNPEVVVPVSLHVTGVPDIEVVLATVDFGQVFVGGSKTETLMVYNDGTDVLNVTGLSADVPDFGAAPSGMTLGIAEGEKVLLTFSPTTATYMPSRLTIVSNDPDEPFVIVDMVGEGVIPPVMAVTPPQLGDSLLTGESAMQQIKIENAPGGSSLDWEISVVEGSAAAAPVIQRARADHGPPPADHSAGYAAFAAGANQGSPTATPTTDPKEVERLQSLAQTTAAEAIIFFDDMESGPNGWTHYPTHASAIDLWSQTTGRSNSATTSWRVSQHPFEGSDALESPPINLGDNTAATLTFMHWYNFDDCEDPQFESDGGIVEVTVNGGATWTQIYPVGGYPNILDNTCGNPLAFLNAYCHDGGVGAAFIPAVFDLTPYVGNVVSIRFHAGWDCGNCSTNEGWYIDDVTVSGEGVPWLQATPKSGTIPPGGFQLVDVTFDAGQGVLGGDYEADIIVSGTDPLNPEAIVEAHLHVTGAPDIVVAPDEIHYGDLFVGLAEVETVVVANVGTDLLSISSVSTDNPDYSVDGAPFVLDPGETRDLPVTFAPLSPGPSPGMLTIASDDPDEPTTNVVLTGTGLEPPVIVVSPDTVRDNLFTGGASSHTAVIENNGGSDLEWTALLELSGSAQEYTLTPPQAGGVDADGAVVASEGARTTSISATLQDLTGVNIMYDVSHGQPSSVGWSLIIADVEARGATVDENAQTITPALLNGYDVVWTTDVSVSWGPGELEALANWITGGGGLIFEGDNTLTVPIYNALLLAVDAGIVYSTNDGTSGTTTNVYPHETTTDVASIYLSANIAQLFTVTAPAARLVDDVLGVANSAYSEVGLGRIVAMADEVFLNSRMGLADNQLFANQVFDWVSGAIEWLSVSPAAGTVPAGQAANVSIDFDATGLIGGEFAANVLFASNDPVNPSVPVAALLHVTGAPDIEVSDSVLTFGTVFIGGSETQTLTVTNEGTDVLVVSSIASDNADFTVNPSNFNLAIEASQNVDVTFGPTSTGPSAATLTITSNDADEPSVAVLVSGNGSEPPVLVVSPESLTESVVAGGSTSQQLTLDNTAGGGDLIWWALLGEGPAEELNDYTLTAPTEGVATPDGGSIPTGVRTTPITIALEDLTDVDILFDRAHGQPSSSAWSTIVSDVISRGATVTENFSLFSSQLLAPYEILWITDITSAMRAGELSVVSNWVHAGGGLILEVDDDLSVASANPLLSVLGAGLQYSTTDGTNGVTTNIHFHAITNGVTSANLVDNTASLSIVIPPAGRLIDDANSIPNSAYQKIGSGRLVVMAEELMHNSLIGLEDHQVFANQVFDWLEVGGGWLSFQPAMGTVPAGASTDVDVFFNAEDLDPGAYDAEIVLLSNDPVNPQVDVPVHLDVTLPAGATSEAGSEKPDLPTEFALHDNHPNPFNPVTTIRFDLPEASDVRIDIYNVRGQLVATLVDERRPAGRHAVLWDGTSATGGQAATGIYFYRLRAGTFTKTKKMTLIK